MPRDLERGFVEPKRRRPEEERREEKEKGTREREGRGRVIEKEKRTAPDRAPDQTPDQAPDAAGRVVMLEVQVQLRWVSHNKDSSTEGLEKREVL